MAATSHESVELTPLLLRGPTSAPVPDDSGRRIQGRRTRGRGIDVRGAGNRGTHPLGEDPSNSEKPVEAVDAVADLVSHRDVLGWLGGLTVDTHVPRLAGTRRSRAGLNLPHAPQPDVDTSRCRSARVTAATGCGLRTSCHGVILGGRAQPASTMCPGPASRAPYSAPAGEPPSYEPPP